MRLTNVMENSNRLIDHTWGISKVSQLWHSSLCPPTPCVSAIHFHSALTSHINILDWWGVKWLTQGNSFSTLVDFRCAHQLQHCVLVSCQWISHLLMFTEWFIATFSVSSPLPHFCSFFHHPTYLSPPSLLPNKLPGYPCFATFISKCLMPLHVQSQHYMSLIIRFPRHSCTYKAQFCKISWIPLELPGSY